MLKLTLEAEAQKQLQKALKTHPKAYVRERASAILQINQGKSGREVAHQGLLRHRRENTIYDWVSRYQEGGLPALLVKTGRGRKAAHFPPQPRAGQSQSRADTPSQSTP